MLDGGGFTGFKAREERRNVVLQAQLLGGRGRRDACILNVSTRGLLVYSDAAASPGSYVEVRRGEQVIVARVVWRRSNRIGPSSQQKLQVGDIVSGAGASALQLTASSPAIERRKLPREDQKPASGEGRPVRRDRCIRRDAGGTQLCSGHRNPRSGDGQGHCSAPRPLTRRLMRAAAPVHEAGGCLGRFRD